MSGPFSVALAFEDGVTRFIGCAAGETVADAAYRQGINIPLDCRDGACGTCKTFCEAGTYDGGDYIEDALTDEEAAQGYGLACQMRPKSDLVLRILASAAACKTAPSRHEGVIGRIDRLSETTTAFTIDVQGAGVGFLPGQYVNIGVPGTGQHRAYSFSSRPLATPEFLVRHIPGGAMTGFLAGAAPGVAVSFTGPIGGFYLRPMVRPVLMLAGGTGLAPFLSMLGHLAAGDGCKFPIHLVYGVTRDADLVHVDALEDMAGRLPGFSFTTTVADVASGHARVGYVTAHMDAAHLHGGDVDVYLCGPPPMVEAVRGHFEAAGISPASFHFEKFAPSGVA